MSRAVETAALVPVQEERWAAAASPPSSFMTARSHSAPRAELPTRAADCPALPTDFGATLDALLPSLGLDLAPAERTAIEAHVRLLLAWNTAINLTAIRDASAVALDHVADALTAIPVIRERLAGGRPTIVDIGSGAGYPGLPIGLSLPAGRLTLVESIAKKSRFLDTACAAVRDALAMTGRPAPELRVETVRAEALAHDAVHRGRHDVVTVRAIGSLAEVAELGLPLLRHGGILVAWKRRGHERSDGDGDALDVEIADALPSNDAVGGAMEDELPVAVPGLEDHRLIVVRSMRPAPAAYPRSPAERRRARR